MLLFLKGQYHVLAGLINFCEGSYMDFSSTPNVKAFCSEILTMIDQLNGVNDYYVDEEYDE